MLLKHEIRKGVKYVKTTGNYFILMKFDKKKYFDMYNDLYVCACPPEGSSAYFGDDGKMLDLYQLLD